MEVKSSHVSAALLIALSLFTIIQLYPVQAADYTQNSWAPLTSMPTARGGFGVAVVDGKIYAIGGINENDISLNVVEEYNPATNDWTSKTPMPTPRSGFAVAVYQNKIYCIGGTIGSKSATGYIGNNEVFDPATNSWQTKNSMPTPRADLSANVVDGKIYLIGGKHYSSSAPFYCETDLNEAYDPTADVWSTKTAIPISVQGYASVVYGSKVYVMGGSRQPSSNGTSTITNATQIYNAQTDSWSQATPMPRNCSYGAASITTGFLAPLRIYNVGGGSSDGQFSLLTDAYDLLTDSWGPAAPMPAPKAYLALVQINDILYALGGFDGASWLNSVDAYKPVGYGTVPPLVDLLSPENLTYQEVSLNFTVDRTTSWTGYSLDDQANVTITSPLKLIGLSQGSHSIIVYANDSQGNMGYSKRVFFSIDIMPPEINIVLPQNASYSTTDIQLVFTVDENVTTFGYSLDGHRIEAVGGNVTLTALSSGRHSLTVYATDMVGNTGEKTIYFEVSPFPLVTVVAILSLGVIFSSSGFILFNRQKENRQKKAALKPRN